MTSRRIRINKRVLTKLPDLTFTQIYALFSVKGDRLRWTTSKNITTQAALKELLLTNQARKGLTWFGVVRPDDLDKLKVLTEKERNP